jgi:hypothetical protein
MSTYRVVCGDDEQVIRETFTDVEIEREDGWVMLFRGAVAILRAREEHILARAVAVGLVAHH